jgi:hypothetical protein
VAVNVTVVSPSMSTFVTVHPAGAARPNASNLAVVAGTTVAGMAIVRPGSGGRISLYHHAGTQHLLVDVLGWFPEGGSLTALTPARLTDTRAGAATVDGAAAGGGPLVGPVVRTIQVAGRGGVPASGVAAVAVNVTAVAPSTSSYLTVYPAGAAAPLASTLNVSPPHSAANMTIVPLGADGRIAVNVPGGSLHLVVDVLAWFTDDPTFTALTPARLADTRPGQPTVDGAHAGGGPALAGSSLTFVAAGRGGVPSTGVGAVVLNLTAVRPTATTFLTAFPAGRARPLASSLNVAAGTTRANLVVVPLGPGGTVSVFQHAGAAHIVVDVVGWFAGDELATELPTIPVEHPRIYLPRNDARLQALIASGDPAASRFLSLMASRRSLSYSSLWNSSYAMWYFALVAQLRGDSSYCDFAVGGVEWFVAAEEARIAAGSTPMVAGDSYLEVGVIVGDVAMVLDWCHDRTTAPQRARWLAYADQAVWNVWNPDDAQWGGRSRPWTGWSIDNPSNNYYYSFLRATMLLGIAGMGELARAETWLHHFRVNKIGGQLVPTFEQDLQGGGSREGTGYGTAMMRLWEIYDLWHGTTGEDLAALTGHTRASLLQFVHYVLPTLDGVSLNGDHSRDSTGEFFDYHRHYAQSLARLVGDDPLARRARWLVDHSSVTSMTSGFMVIFDFIYAGSGTPAQPLTGLNTTYHAPGVGQVYTRSSWGADAAWLNFTAGPYTESHAHRDQGSFLLYRDEWLAYDPNYHSHSGIEQEEDTAQPGAHHVRRRDPAPVGRRQLHTAGAAAGAGLGAHGGRLHRGVHAAQQPAGQQGAARDRVARARSGGGLRPHGHRCRHATDLAAELAGAAGGQRRDRHLRRRAEHAHRAARDSGSGHHVGVRLEHRRRLLGRLPPRLTGGRRGHHVPARPVVRHLVIDGGVVRRPQRRRWATGRADHLSGRCPRPGGARGRHRARRPP